MFPIPFNFPFRKSNGNLTTIGAAINEGGGGEPYVLPTASANVKGGVKIGNGLSMVGEVLNAVAELPAYSSTTAGKVLTVGDDGSLEWDVKGTGGGNVYGSVIRPIFETDPNSASYYVISSTNRVIEREPDNTVFTTGDYTINDVFYDVIGTYDNFEYYQDVDAHLINDLSLVELAIVLTAANSVTLSDSLTNYSHIVLQGCYGETGVSIYDTTAIYKNPTTNQKYWFGMKDRNNTYGGFIKFTDNTHGDILDGNNSPISRRVKIYGILK